MTSLRRPGHGGAARSPARAAGRCCSWPDASSGWRCCRPGRSWRRSAISLTKWDLLTAAEFVGLDNFVALLTDDRFLMALRNTIFYTVVSVPLGLAIALAWRWRSTSASAGIAWIRTAYFLPVVTSTIAVALVWLWIYSPSGGLLNEVLGLVGLPAQRWIGDPILGDAVDRRR